MTVFPESVDPAELMAFEIWDCTNAANVGEDFAVVFARLNVMISMKFDLLDQYDDYGWNVQYRLR